MARLASRAPLRRRPCRTRSSMGATTNASPQGERQASPKAKLSSAAPSLMLCRGVAKGVVAAVAPRLLPAQLSPTLCEHMLGVGVKGSWMLEGVAVEIPCDTICTGQSASFARPSRSAEDPKRAASPPDSSLAKARLSSSWSSL
eukprot:CAMPEP_0170580758 /NCGR_PEP_ID=MMETSP0224-20130122/6677_1 /TAXON_ID=285029 /ORGANISM="Togula jolla, Strain CCCM 725" /LENGTH=143 /DNA_ID=CAMNT_0010903849 /DNA_START=687 /DNA_END=1114 /DNA_ORIENTATION=+